MIAKKLAFAVLTLIVLLAIAFFAVYRKTGTVTVGAIDLYLCLHNLKYIILLRLSPFFYYSSILFDTPPFFYLFLSAYPELGLDNFVLIKRIEIEVLS